MWFVVFLCHLQADDHYVVIADVPGVSKDRLTIAVKDDMIMIEGKRKKKVITDEDVAEQNSYTFRESKLIQQFEKIFSIIFPIF